MSTLDRCEIRKRIEVEDSLLNSRTTIFLATNGIWLAALGVRKYGELQIGIAIFGVILSGVWFVCGRQSRNVISALTKRYRKEFPIDEIDNTVRNAMWKPGWRSPTDLLGWELPVLFILAWSVLLIWELFK